MSNRASAILWLIIALFCGLLSLAGCAGGGYGIWFLQDKVETLDKQIAEDNDEKNNSKKLIKIDRIEELEKRIDQAERERADHVQYRHFAVAGAAVSLIPSVMTLAFLMMAFITFQKKPRRQRSREDDESDAGDVDEQPPANDSRPDGNG